MTSALRERGRPAERAGSGPTVALDVMIEAGGWPGEAVLETLTRQAIRATLDQLGASQSSAPPHPASAYGGFAAELGHPLPAGERRSSPSAPTSPDSTESKANASKTSSPQRGEGGRAKRRPGEGAFEHSPSELSIVFTDDDHIRTLNAEWRGKDKPTNVLSFPAFPPKKGSTALPPMLGDIVLAFETVAREATLEEKPFDHHLSHLLVHGLLHLLGYDHETDAEAVEMEELERRILARLAIRDPYA